MNSMPAAMTIALAHQRRDDLLADAGRRRRTRAARRAARADVLVLHERPDQGEPAPRRTRSFTWPGSPAASRA